MLTRSVVQGFMGEVYASFVFIIVLYGTVVDKRYSPRSM